MTPEILPGDEVMGLYPSNHIDSPHVFRGFVKCQVKKTEDEEFVGYRVFITVTTPPSIFESPDNAVKVIDPKYIIKFDDVWYRRLKKIHSHPGPERAKINLGEYILTIAKYANLTFESISQSPEEITRQYRDVTNKILSSVDRVSADTDSVFLTKPGGIIGGTNGTIMMRLPDLLEDEDISKIVLVKKRGRWNLSIEREES